MLTTDKALPCAMLVKELVSNALKYAFPEGRGGKIELRLHEQDGQVTLAVRDNDVGLPDEVDIEQTNSLGLRLVRGFILQLPGRLELDRSTGTTFTITFPKGRS